MFHKIPIKNIGFSSKKSIWLIGIVYVTLAFSFANWNHNKIIQADAIVYYQYLTAAFQFNDMSFSFIYDMPDDFDGTIWTEVKETGVHNKVTMGLAIMLAPFYLMAYGIDALFGLGSYGYSSVFQFFIFIAGLFYGLTGLVLVRKILLKWFSDNTVSLTLLIIGIGTNLCYYSVLCPGITHVYSFFLFALLLWLSIGWFEKVSLKATFFMGLTLGLITLVRPTNALVVLVPLLFGITDHASVKSAIKYYLHRFPYFLLMALGTFLVVSLQLLFWKYSVESWFVYSYGDESFFWSDPKLIEGLFSVRKGWLLYTPLMTLVFLGAFIRNTKVKAVKPAILVFIALNIYLIFSWWCWWYGGGFSARPLVESYAVLAVLVALTVEQGLKISLLKRIMIPIVSLLLVLNIFQTQQFEKGIIHYDGMTWEGYKRHFFATELPKDFYQYVKSPDYEEAKKGNR